MQEGVHLQILVTVIYTQYNVHEMFLLMSVVGWLCLHARCTATLPLLSFKHKRKISHRQAILNHVSFKNTSSHIWSPAIYLTQMWLLAGVAIVLTASGIQTVSAVSCNCTGFNNCSWTAWSTEFPSISYHCSTGVPVWRGCFCNDTNCNVTKCEPYSCGPWGSWGGWSAKCGTRSRDRSRSCKTSSNVTYSNVNVTRSIEMQPVWLSWSAWSNWSAPCGVPGRDRSRTRDCSQNMCPSDHDDLSTCVGLRFDTETEPAPSWSDWSLWGQWTATCDSRVRIRLRNCTAGTCGMVSNCSGPSNKTEMDPNPPCCPVNANWALWGRWSDWSATCGNRTHSRYRNCSGALCGGQLSCPGTSMETQSDTNPLCCPVDAVWSKWTEWGGWTAICGNRSRERIRQCIPGSCGGNTSCSGVSLETLQDLNTPSCPVTVHTIATPTTETNISTNLTAMTSPSKSMATDKSTTTTGSYTDLLVVQWLVVLVSTSVSTWSV
jgi:hypothetical protein